MDTYTLVSDIWHGSCYGLKNVTCETGTVGPNVSNNPLQNEF